MPKDPLDKALGIEMHNFLTEMCFYRFRHGPDCYFVEAKLHDVAGFYEANSVTNAVKYILGHVKPELIYDINTRASLEVAIQDKVKRWRFIDGTRYGAAERANEELDALDQMKR